MMICEVFGLIKTTKIYISWEWNAIRVKVFKNEQSVFVKDSL